MLLVAYTVVILSFLMKTLGVELKLDMKRVVPFVVVIIIGLYVVIGLSSLLVALDLAKVCLRLW